MAEEPAQRMSDRDREQTAPHRKGHTVPGCLTLGELARRAELAERAEPKSDLQALTADLPADRAPAPARRSASLVSIVGDVRRAGPWRVASDVGVVGVLGELELNEGDAAIESNVTTISLSSLLGDVSFALPLGVRVDTGATVLIGDVNEGSAEPPPPRAPTVRVSAPSLVGEVRIRRRES